MKRLAGILASAGWQCVLFGAVFWMAGGAPSPRELLLAGGAAILLALVLWVTAAAREPEGHR